MSTQKNNGPTKYANSNLNSVFAKSSTSSSTSSTGPSVNKYNGLLVLSKQRLRPSSTAAGPKLAVPKPVNLPSMRKEHAGNDPTTVLVPTGGTSSGWNKPEDPSAQPADSNRASGVASGATWAGSRTQSPAWAPTPSEAAKAAQAQPHVRSAVADRHLNPEEYPSLGATARTHSQPLPRRSAFTDQQNQDHLWTDDERNVPSAATYKQNQEWGREADDDRYVSRTPWDAGKSASGFFGPSRSFSTGELHDDYVPRRFEFDAPPPPPPARRPGPSAPIKGASGYASGFEYYHDDTALFPPPPPPPGRPHDAAASDKSDEEDVERNAFYETLDKVAAELQKRKEETEKEKEKEKEMEKEAEPEPLEPEPEAEPEQEAAEEPAAVTPPLPASPPEMEEVEVEETPDKVEKPKADSPTEAGAAAAARNKLVIQPRKTQRELEYEEEEKRRKAAAAEKLRQLEERMERQKREREESQAKARAEEEAAKKAAAAALQPHAPTHGAATPVSASTHGAAEPSGLSTPTEEEAEAWGEKGFKGEEEKPLVVEEEEEDAEPPKPAEPAAVLLDVPQDAPTAPSNAWQRGPPIQPASMAAVNMAASRFGNFDDDLLEDISKAAKQQTTVPVAPPARGKGGANSEGLAAKRPASQQGSWRSQAKSEDSSEYDSAAGYDRSGRRGRGGRGSCGGRTPDSGTPRSSRSSVQGTEPVSTHSESRTHRGKGARNERGAQRANDRSDKGANERGERGARLSGKEDAAAEEKVEVMETFSATVGTAREDASARPGSAPPSEQSSTDGDGKGKKNSNGRMHKDALVPPPSSTSISKAPGAGRGRNERHVASRANTPPSGALTPDPAAAQAAAAVAVAVAGVTGSGGSSSTSSQVQASNASTSLLTPALVSPRGLPPTPGATITGRPLDSRAANPTVDVKVPAPLGPSTQPSPQPLARSPVMGTDPSSLWGAPNIVKDIASMSLGPQLTGSDPLHLGPALPAAGKPVQLGAPPLHGFDRQIGPRQGPTGKELGGAPEALAGDVLGNGMPNFPENLMDMVQSQHKPPGPPIPFPPPPGASNSMARPLGPNSFPFHAPADSTPGSNATGSNNNPLNLWGPTPLTFGQHPAGSMHHASSQPAPASITAALESFYNPTSMFPSTSVPMHPPAAPTSPSPHHPNPALMNPVLAGLHHQFGQHFPNLYAPHTQFGTMGTTFGQFHNQAFVPTGKQPDWSTPNPIGMTSNNPVINAGLVRPPGSLDAMLPSPYPLSGNPQQAVISADPSSHYQPGLNQPLGTLQQGMQQGMQSLSGSNSSTGFANMIPGSKQGPSSNLPIKLGQGGANSLMMGTHQGGPTGMGHQANAAGVSHQGGTPASNQPSQMPLHGKSDNGPLNKGRVPQLPDDVFPGMEPSSTITVTSLQNHAPTSNGQSDSQLGSKQSTPPGLAPPHASQQVAHHSNQHGHHHQGHSNQHGHHNHHPHQGTSASGDRTSSGQHERHHEQHPGQRGSGSGHGASNVPPTGSMKHGGRGGRAMNSSGSSSSRGERGLGGRGSSCASRSPVRSSEGSSGPVRNRGGSGSGSARGSGGEKPSQQAPPAAAAAAAAAAVAALISGSSTSSKDAPGNAAAPSSGQASGAPMGTPPPISRNANESGGRGRGRNSAGGRVPSAGARGRGPAGGPKTMYVPKGTIPPNAQVKTEAG